MAQCLRNYTDQVQAKKGREFNSKCAITLTFPVKPGFQEAVLRFEVTDSTMLYMLCFEALQQKFSISKKRLKEYNNDCETFLADDDPPLHCETDKIAPESSPLCSSVVSTEK